MKKIILFLFILQLGSISLYAQSIRVMSLNVRCDVQEDGNQSWSNRKGLVAKAIKFYNADMIGTQEVLNNQYIDLCQELPEYDSYGVGREDGLSGGERMALFWKKGLFQIRKKGTFWLSQTPNVPSKGWDAAYPRTVTWVILYDKKMKKEILVVNTHLDHIGKQARILGINLLISRIANLAKKRPVVLMGDFNSVPDDPVVLKILNKKNSPRLFSSRNEASIVYGPEWTFHDFGKLPLQERCKIDYIFYSGFSLVERYASLCECINDVYLSDHCPILSDLKF